MQVTRGHSEPLEVLQNVPRTMMPHSFWVQDIARRTQQDLEASAEKQASPRESLEAAQAVMLRETTASEGDDVSLGADLFSVGAAPPRRLTRWQRARNGLRRLWRRCTRPKRTGTNASAEELNMALGQPLLSSVGSQMW